MSSTVTQAVQDLTSKHWKVTVRSSNGSERIFNVKHIVFSTGFGSAVPNTPKIPGAVSMLLRNIYKKQMSFAYRKNSGGRFFIRLNTSELLITQGRRLSLLAPALQVRHVFLLHEIKAHAIQAHDIAHDYYVHGVGNYLFLSILDYYPYIDQDVTMYQRSSTYVMSVKSAMDVFFASRSISTDLLQKLTRLLFRPLFRKWSSNRYCRSSQCIISAFYEHGTRTTFYCPNYQIRRVC